jgi:hypothetical protein
MVNAHPHDSVCNKVACQTERGVQQSNCLINQSHEGLVKRRPHAAFGKTTQNRALIRASSGSFSEFRREKRGDALAGTNEVLFPDFEEANRICSRIQSPVGNTIINSLDRVV